MELAMRNYMHLQALTAVATELDANVVPQGRGRHQLDFSGSTGSVAIAVDFGTGYRTINTVDLTLMDRLPFCFECAAEKIRVTPTVSCDLAYYFDRV